MEAFPGHYHIQAKKLCKKMEERKELGGSFVGAIVTTNGFQLHYEIIDRSNY